MKMLTNINKIRSLSQNSFIQIYKRFFKTKEHDKYEVDNPYTFEKLPNIPFLCENEISKILELADSASTLLSSTNYEERISMCNLALKWISKNKEKIAVEITNYIGKPITQSRNEVEASIYRAQELIKIAPEILEEETIESNSENLLQIAKEPIGVSLIITPWNDPLLSSISNIIPSIICGNSVLLKPHPRTPLLYKNFEEAFNYGGALNVVQNLYIQKSSMFKVFKHRRLNYLGYIGNLESGRDILEDFSKTRRFIQTYFEMGAKNAAYVFDDADIDLAVESIIGATMLNSGQSSSSIHRVYVDSSVYELFLEKAYNLISTYSIGDPMNENTKLGPIALPDVTIYLKQLVNDAVHNGASIVYGGSPVPDINGKGRFFEPTLIRECHKDMEIMYKEFSGPILPVCSVDNDIEAIELINNSQFGICAALFTKDISKAKELAKQIKVGTVYLNRCNVFNPLLPNGGVKYSGFGYTLSKYGFYPFIKLKSFNFKIPQ